MLLQVYICCFCIFLTEANKIGLVGRSSEEQSSLKTEVMKYKSSECGGTTSSEESHEKSKKNNKKDSDESDSSDSEEDQKKKRGKGRNKYNSRHHDADDSNSREYGNGGYNYGQSSPGGYPGRRPSPDERIPYHQNPYQDPYHSRNPPYPGRPTNGRYPPRETMPYPPMENDPFQRPGGNRPYSGRPEVSYPDRGTGGYGTRYPYQNGRNPFQNGDMYPGRRDSFQNPSGSASREYGRGSHRSGHSRNHGSKRKTKKPSKNESSDEECTSQCVFNNMDIMEDDGIPSESAMIKWAQDKLKNEKLKNSAVKEIRKCFGSLASSDGDNSCNFSKSLASCLKLDLDDE